MKLAPIKLFETLPNIIKVWRPGSVVSTSPLVKLVELALKHDAFIAGGFARRIATHLDPLNGFRIKRAHLDSHLLKADLDLYRIKGGDIDIFFVKGFEEIQRHVKGIQKRPGLVEATVDEMRVQLIVAPANIPELLASFDIYNAALAFDATTMWFPDGWLPLEQENMLHVQNWKSSLNTIQRLGKWAIKHNLLRLSPKTASEIGTHAMIAIEAVKQSGVTLPCWDGGEEHVTRLKIIDGLVRLMPAMTNEQLLLLTTVIPPTERFYKFKTPFEILSDRSKAITP